MEWLLWLLLPIAAASGWFSAKKSSKKTLSHSKFTTDISESYIKGVNFLIDEQPDKAIATFLETLELDHNTLETHLLMGSLYRRRGEVDRAIKIHQNIMARPTLTKVQKDKAMFQLSADYMKAGLLERAESLLLQLLEKTPGNLEAKEKLCVLYEQEKEWQKAINISIKPSRPKNNSTLANYYCEMAQQYMQANQLEKAYQYLTNALQSNKDSRRAHLMIGDYYRLNQKPKRAIKSYKTSLALFENKAPFILERFAMLYQEQDATDKYIDLLEELDNSVEGFELTNMLLDTYSEHNMPDKYESYIKQRIENKEVSNMNTYIEHIKHLTKHISAEGPYISALKVLVEHEGSLLQEHSDNYLCSHCGFSSQSHFWQCPSCRRWDSIEFSPIKVTH